MENNLIFLIVAIVVVGMVWSAVAERLGLQLNPWNRKRKVVVSELKSRMIFLGAKLHKA